MTTKASLWTVVRAIWQHSGKSRRLIPLQFVILTIDAMMQSLVPAVLGYVVNQLLKDPQQFVSEQLLWLSGAAILAAAVFYAIAVTQHYLGQKIGALALIGVQSELYRHLQRLGADFYQRTHVGEVTQRLTADTSRGVQELYGLLIMLYWSSVLLLSSIVIMARLNLKMLAVFLSILACLFATSRFVLPILRRLHREAQDEMGRINARMTEDIASISLIQAYAREASTFENVTQLWHSFLHKTLRSRLVGVFYSDIINTFMTFLGPMAMLFLGSLLISDTFSVATLVAFYAYWRSSAWPASSLVQTLAQLFASLASFDRIMEFFNESPTVQDRPDAREAVLKGTVEFDHVWFRYPLGNNEYVIRDLSFRVNQDQSLAIVGESGAGKSTILQMLLRFYTPQQGEIRVDGQNVLDLKLASLREQVGVVMQETIILSGTIRHNMLLAKPDAGDPEIIAALDAAEAWTFIKEMPDKLDTILGERGTRLSGGQKQRLAIARVLLKNPPIVVLDEATSSLDSVTEKRIQDTMKRLFRDRTSIVVAHRLSTVIDSSQILFLEKGQVLAVDSHAELVETCPAYRELCLKQQLVAA